MRTSVPAPRRMAFGAVLLVGLVALAAAGKAVLFDTLDPDCFLHLLAAEQLLNDGIGPLADHQSFASVSTPWTPYAWLAELGMKAVWDAGGYRAAVAVHAVLAAGIVTLVALSCVVRSRPPGEDDENRDAPPATSTRPPAVSRLAAVVATAFAAFLTLPYLSFRPVTAAVLLLAAAMLLLVRDRRLRERTRAVWLLVPLTALAINIHLFAVAVPMFVGAMFLGALWERRTAYEPPDWPEADRRAGRYGVLLLGVSLACLATPMLRAVPDALVHAQSDPIVTGPVIAEYQPFYRGTFGTAAAVVVGLMVLGAFVRRQNVRAGELILLLIAWALLMRMGRFAPVFAVAAAPVLAAGMPRLSDRLLARPLLGGLVAAVLVLGLLRIGAAFPKLDQPLEKWVNRHGEGTPGYPCDAADFVERTVRPVHGRLINEYTWGGYLEWRFRNQYQALLDGRTQCFSNELWRLTYLSGEGPRKDFLARLGADAAVLPAERSLFRGPLIELGWTPAYRDDRAEVLLPPNGRTEASTPLDFAWTAGFFGQGE